MSFGFSIGDIILLSQLAYNLYASISSGRQAASRDLKELEEVLFSLKCALDHLGEVSNDVLARPGFRYGGSGFKEKLDVMINSCASTLQELDSVTKKYRDVESKADKGKSKLRTLEDVKKSIQVNWQRVRWDYEKQSLQEYREKLKSHTDAINLLLTSVIWANTASAYADSKKNHEVTQSLLVDVLRNPAADERFRAMVQEIHAILTRPTPVTEVVEMATIQGTALSCKQLCTDTCSPSGLSVFESSGPVAKQGRNLPSVAMYAVSDLPYTTSTAKAYVGAVSKGDSTQGAVHATSWKSQATDESEFCKEDLQGHSELSVATVKLNNERRAFGAKEYQAFLRQHAQLKRVPKPSFLTGIMPTSQELQACIPYIFQSTVEGKQQTQELRNEIDRWTEGFSRFVNHKAPPREKDECFLMLLGALNEAVENSSRGTRQLFYEISDSSGFATALDQVQTTSKSVRVMKEIEEFEDAKEEWEKQERVR
ncbi:hypothetical protein GT037_009397 [Alternaria burnsii]|uniref:Fungal N-terminal domain-containing protein n=1 Tax=Alternaria burnsii TaxID=1187904 RepID=A0A8H7AW17_9PLEO|nr:uncharacterized protein GT037_009397 [Alternaria burnsii]KAF7672366.1 hypothetical protein GT037_009397 [Alternaria burnsii]